MCYVLDKTPEIHTEVACEGNVLSLQCEFMIEIQSANYGRTVPDSEQCSFGRPHENKVDCVNREALAIVEEACNNRSACTVSAGNGVFGDPCTGTYKYLEVKYRCIPGKFVLLHVD